MADREKLFGEKSIDIAFKISLVSKGVFALMEIVAGIFICFVTRQFLLDLIYAIMPMERMENTHDFIINYLFQSVQGLSVSSQHFAALYLLSHGIIKLWLIIGLWQKRIAYYPVTIVVFGMFIFYQLYRYSFTHSLLLLVITALDAAIIGLAWIEYRRLHFILSVRRE